MIGDPIPEGFSPDDPLARFVVAMSMANNNINRAFPDLLRSADADTPAFAYHTDGPSRVYLKAAPHVHPLNLLSGRT